MCVGGAFNECCCGVVLVMSIMHCSVRRAPQDHRGQWTGHTCWSKSGVWSSRDAHRPRHNRDFQSKRVAGVPARVSPDDDGCTDDMSAFQAYPGEGR